MASKVSDVKDSEVVKEKLRLVVAIDFGSYASGYALQWRSDYESDPLKVYVNTNWVCNNGFCTYKTPTVVLLKPDKTIAEFGYEAETKYCELKDDDEEDQQQWYLFRNFKMILYQQDGDLSLDTLVEGANGKHLPAIEVFSKAVGYMKKEALNHFEESGSKYLENDTKWVITVPAIWSDPAKTIMREAAEMAGIPSTNLTIALEPECAAVYCSKLPRNQLEVAGGEGEAKFIAEPGSVVMVVDMGGGTVDITTMKINEDSTMEHVQMSGGGPWGGMGIDEKFFKLFKDLVGEKVFDEFVQDNEQEFLDLKLDFESSKRKVTHPSDKDSKTNFRIRMPQTLKELWEEKEGKRLVDILKEPKCKEKGLRLSSGRLLFNSQAIWDIFEESTKEVLAYIKEQLDKEEEKHKVTSLVVVGGFAMSIYVIKEIRKGLETYNIPVIRPQATELAVLYGAVLFGQNEDIVISRLSHYTYGIAFTMEFVEGKHSEENAYTSEGKKWANAVFRKHVTIGEKLEVGKQVMNKDYFPAEDDQSKVTIYVFTSKQPDPVHTTEPDCKCIGNFVIEFPNVGQKTASSKRAVNISMRFGGTEVEVTAKDVSSGKRYSKWLKLA